LAEEHRDIRLRKSALGDPDHEVDQLIVAGLDAGAVQAQEGQGARQ